MVKEIDKDKIIKEYDFKFKRSIIQKINEIVNYILGKKEFIAYVTQTGVSAPVIVSVIKDELGLGTPTFARSGAGSYTMTVIPASFTANKTNVCLQNVVSGTIPNAYISTNKIIAIETYSIADADLNDGAITGNILKITVYR